MNTVKIRNITIGEGLPKICVPIVGKTTEEILNSAKAICQVGADIVEWRVDWYEDVFDLEKVKDTARKLREVLGKLVLLFTFRTSKEGGEKSIEPQMYQTLNQEIAKTGYVDLIDVEAFSGDDEVKTIIEFAHNFSVKVIGSNHDFDKTPNKSDIIYRLRKMQDLGVDIPKIAVMPQTKEDVLTLLLATNEMVTCYANRPIITMSMAGTGVISRLCGEVFGSAITFGSVGKASAPGQMNASDLKEVLTLLHNSL
ncbi:3-dehydroquinate dehydratase I [Lachnospiraceae bacterium TWA4]|nr:3-dehydroquinate dehydratase I [Lachnospiraceae bacterium TWA4]